MSRTVLTTGANSGIGLAITLALARCAFRSVGSVRSAEKAREVAEAAAQAGVSVETVLLDVTNAEQCARVIDELRPYGLVNNAGCAAGGAIEDVPDEEARHLLETMVIAPIRLARLALPHMRARDGGRIVNLSSVYGWTTTPLAGWYGGAKHALEALSDALRVEVASSGVTVILVEPGTVRTAIWEEAAQDMGRRGESRYAAAYRRGLTAIRWTRPFMTEPSSVAAAITHAMTTRSPRARYLVGYDAHLLAVTDRLPALVRDPIARFLLGL